MKKTLLSALLLALFCFTGCEKDCDEWHEGKGCKTVVISKYYGTYSVLYTDDLGFTEYFTLEATAFPNDPSKLLLSGLKLEFINPVNFRIPSQLLNTGNSIRAYSGNGFFYQNGFYSNVTIDGVDYTLRGTK